jgi:hypothetical protein
MFDSLSATIRHDDAVEISRTERIVKAVVIAVFSILLFGGLYYAVRMVG